MLCSVKLNMEICVIPLVARSLVGCMCFVAYFEMSVDIQTHVPYQDLGRGLRSLKTALRTLLM